MTICIAAISKENSEEHIIFSTDHMVTTNMGQFEHSILKYIKLNNNTVAMLAGEALLFNDLVKLDDCNIGYEQIKTEIFNNFKKKRKEVIENEIFNIFGIDQQFFVNSLQSPIPNPFIHSVLQQVADFKLKTTVLLIGFVDSVAQIANVEESGILDFRPMNFHAIGSGGMQAANTLLFQKHSRIDSLKTTIYNVYKAKKNAEVSEGVGKETEILVLSEGGVKQLSTEDVGILDKIYTDELKYGKYNEELGKLSIGVT